MKSFKIPLVKTAKIWKFFRIVTVDGVIQRLTQTSFNINVFGDFLDDIWTNKRKSVLGAQCELKATIKAELSQYRPERSENIFVWWRKNKACFSKCAKILLCVPATSVSSERTFSIAGLLYSNTLRNRIHGTIAKMLVLIKANLNKLKLDPTTVPDDEELQEYELEIRDLKNVE